VIAGAPLDVLPIYAHAGAILPDPPEGTSDEGTRFRGQTEVRGPDGTGTFTDEGFVVGK
jgi:hypothetical protein